MTPTTNFGVKLDNVLLDPQPSRFIPTPPKAQRFQDIAGGYISFAREFGWEFQLEWGSGELVDNDPLETLQGIYDPVQTKQLKFTWFDTVEYEFTVIWTERVSAAFRWSSIAEKFSVTLRQAAVVE